MIFRKNYTLVKYRKLLLFNYYIGKINNNNTLLIHNYLNKIIKKKLNTACNILILFLKDALHSKFDSISKI